MAEELPNLFDAVRKANREVWEQASGRKSRGKSDEVPPPTGRESPLEGADATAMVAALSAKLSELQARVDYIEGDFPETELMNSGEGQSGGRWSGIVWWMGAIKYDFSKGGASPSGDPAAGGLSGEIGGIFLIIDLRDGSYSWSDSAPDSEETAAYKNYYPVGSSDGGTPPGYSLSVGRVVGDIRIDYVPYHAPLEEAAEES